MIRLKRENVATETPKYPSSFDKCVALRWRNRSLYIRNFQEIYKYEADCQMTYLQFSKAYTSGLVLYNSETRRWLVYWVLLKGRVCIVGNKYRHRVIICNGKICFKFAYSNLIMKAQTKWEARCRDRGETVSNVCGSVHALGKLNKLRKINNVIYTKSQFPTARVRHH